MNQELLLPKKESVYRDVGKSRLTKQVNLAGKYVKLLIVGCKVMFRTKMCVSCLPTQWESACDICWRLEEFWPSSVFRQDSKRRKEAEKNVLTAFPFHLMMKESKKLQNHFYFHCDFYDSNNVNGWSKMPLFIMPILPEQVSSFLDSSF